MSRKQLALFIALCTAVSAHAAEANNPSTEQQSPRFSTFTKFVATGTVTGIFATAAYQHIKNNPSGYVGSFFNALPYNTWAQSITSKATNFLSDLKNISFNKPSFDLRNSKIDIAIMSTCFSAIVGYRINDYYYKKNKTSTTTDQSVIQSVQSPSTNTSSLASVSSNESNGQTMNNFKTTDQSVIQSVQSISTSTDLANSTHKGAIMLYKGPVQSPSTITSSLASVSSNESNGQTMNNFKTINQDDDLKNNPLYSIDLVDSNVPGKSANSTKQVTIEISDVNRVNSIYHMFGLSKKITSKEEALKLMEKEESKNQALNASTDQSTIK